MARSPGFVLALGCAVGLGSAVGLDCAVAAPIAAAATDGKPASTPDAKADGKSDAKPAAAPDTKPAAKPDAKPAAKPDAKQAAKSQTKAATKSATKTKAKTKQARRATTSIGAHTTNPSDADDTPAVRYAKLSQDECEAELDNRQIDYQRETGDAVLAPVRLTGPLHGVVFRTDGTEDQREASPYEIADCRLVLALDDFSQILERHDIVEVRHYSMYRPPHGWPAGKIGKQHAGALALDAGRFIDKDGKTLDVDRDFHGAIGAKTCGDGAGPRPSTPSGVALRSILCEAVAERMFNVVLTPNFNRPHHNHFHLEVMAGVRWFLVH